MKLKMKVNCSNGYESGFYKLSIKFELKMATKMQN